LPAPGDYSFFFPCGAAGSGALHDSPIPVTANMRRGDSRRFAAARLHLGDRIEPKEEHTVRSLGWLWGSLFCGLVGLAVLSAAAPASIFGTYSKPGAPDSIELKSAAAGKVGVAIRLVYAAGQSCQLEKMGVWKDHKVIVKAGGLTEDEPCVLELTFHGGQVRLKDAGLRCSKVFCGTHGTLDAVSLPKRIAATNKKPDR
jgi:hypothetical protein